MKQGITIEQVDGTSRLHYAARHRHFTNCVELANASLEGLNTILTEGAQEPTKELCLSILNQGGQAIIDNVVDEYNAWAQAVNQPTYLHAIGLDAAKQSISVTLVSRLNEWNTSFWADFRAWDVPSCTINEFNWSGGRLVLSKRYIDRVTQSFYIPISDEIRDKAVKVQQVVQQLRELETNGVDAIYLLGTYLGNRFQPDMLPDISLDSIAADLITGSISALTYDAIKDDKERVVNCGIAMDARIWRLFH